ncbi:hypothetical protein SDC9_65014 [bioreactor metagenome]|uniref:VWFA domain-containing protein n=1 Tax=bioreactor metagenome TaxID=1076179 RepID=A0A644XS63_9ZZZZ
MKKNVVLVAGCLNNKLILMKKILFYLTGMILFIPAALSQGSCLTTIHVYDNHGQPMANTQITLIETSSKAYISKKTNSSGEAVIDITSGKEWSLSVGKIKNYKLIEIPENGKATRNMNITYDYADWERSHRPPVDRSTMNLTTVPIPAAGSKPVQGTEAIIRLKINRENNSPLANFPVNLTCYSQGKTFLGKTNAAGVASFIVPVNSEYEVDIEGSESFTYVDTKQSGEYSLSMTFEPTYINEVEKNDTIIQQLTSTSNGTSSRVLVRMKVSQPGKDNLGNEDVYLQMLKSNKVYKAKTNDKGEAYFLVPKKRKYMVHFRYQKDVDVLNYLDVQGIASADVNFAYIPDPKLQYPEKYIPTPQDLMVREFFEFIAEQFPEPADNNALGMTVSWGNEMVNAQSKEALLQIGFKAREDNGDIYGPPLNIALVVDKSGSMEGSDRIDALKKALLNYIGKLRKTDIVSLIAFDTESTILVPAQPVGDGQYLRDMIEDIEAGGGTNIYNGMVDGYEQILKNFIPKGTNRLVLLTDGYGTTPVEEIVGKSKEYNAKGIQLSAVGVGEGYNQSLLALLATEGGGLLQFAGSSSEINRVFERELTSVLSPCAKDVHVEIVYNDQIVYKQLYGFPVEQRNASTIDMKLDNIYPGLNTLALVKFDLHNPTKEIENNPVIVRMQYYDFKKQQQVTSEDKAFLKWSPATGQFELVMEAQHKKLYAIAILNQSLKVMTEAHYVGDTQGALNAINSALDQVKAIYPESKDEDVQKLVDSINNYALALSRVLKNKKENNTSH